jgi:hypothetical protein
MNNYTDMYASTVEHMDGAQEWLPFYFKIYYTAPLSK